MHVNSLKMRRFFAIVILNFTLLTWAEKAGHDISVYVNYLLKFGKPITRISEPARVALFFENVRYIYIFETSKISTLDDPSSAQFSLGLNEMSDWLHHEVESRFSVPLDNLSLLSLPSVDRHRDFRNGDFRAIRKNHRTLINRKFSSPEDGFKKSKNLSLLSPVEVPSTDADGFIDNMSWASSSNPKGVPVLSIVRNQGMCGACWAFVATSSVEAQVRIAGGKQIPLSVQELVDCDTALNRGCNGGNPLYAFEYTMANALTSWEDYPYRESASICRRNNFRARSSVEGYRRLPPNDQQQLLQYVQMAPVAVGICGTDKSFMFYSRGVFNAASCCNTQNHAVLLVGYGHDSATDLDYWIALNSWGVAWGERGYVRLLRTNDTASPGQCGLAMNPVAALGGYVLSRDDLDADDELDKGDKRWPNVHQLPFWAAITVWLGNNWQTVCLLAACCLMSLSLGLLLYASYTDYAQALEERKRQRNMNFYNQNGNSYYQGGNSAVQGEGRAGEREVGEGGRGPSDSLYYQYAHTHTTEAGNNNRNSHRGGGRTQFEGDPNSWGGAWGELTRDFGSFLTVYPGNAPASERRYAAVGLTPLSAPAAPYHRQPAVTSSLSHEDGHGYGRRQHGNDNIM